VEVHNIIFEFLSAAAEDYRIAPNHISLFMAIVFFHQRQNYQVPISIHSKELMRQAKIQSPSTYTKCMYELKEYGFIDYIPSYNPLLGSLIYPLKIKQ
jgi:hypothetical protein